jgi:hypothetical protein
MRYVGELRATAWFKIETVHQICVSMYFEK